MAFDYNDGLDDELVPDEVADFAGGVDMQVNPVKALPNQSAEFINVDVVKVAEAQTRLGATKLGSALTASSRIQGLGEFDSTDLERLIACCNNSLKTYNGTTWSSALAGYTATANSQVEFVQGGGVTLIMDGTQQMFAFNGTTVAAQGTGGSNPPIFSFGEWHIGRFYGAGVSTNRDGLYRSRPGIGGAGGYDSTEEINIGEDDGDSIKSVRSWVENYLVVFKEHSFFIINADPTIESMADFVIQTGSTTIGTVAHRTVKVLGNDMLFLSQDGVRSILQVQESGKNNLGLPLSWPMQPIIDRINWTVAHKSCAIAFDNRYMLSLPIDDATEPNYTIVYNSRIQQWTGYWTGWTPTIFLYSKIGTQKRCLFGQSDGLVRQWMSNADQDDDSSYLDDTTDIATSMKTRAMNFGAPQNLKSGWSVEMEFAHSQATASAFAILDNGDDDVIEANFVTQDVQNPLPLILPFTLTPLKDKTRAFDLAKFGEFRQVQIKLTSDAGKLNCRRISANGFLQGLEYEK
jgi:hypothetical protein